MSPHTSNGSKHGPITFGHSKSFPNENPSLTNIPLDLSSTKSTPYHANGNQASVFDAPTVKIQRFGPGDLSAETKKIQRSPYNFKEMTITCRSPLFTIKLEKNSPAYFLTRSNNNAWNIPLSNGTVSTLHASLKWSNINRFVLQDEGSTAGTYIKMARIEVFQDLLVEIGDIIYRCIVNQSARVLTLKIYEYLSASLQGTLQDVNISFASRTTITLGKLNTDVVVADRKLSDRHCEISWYAGCNPCITAFHNAEILMRLSASKVRSQEVVVPPDEVSTELDIRCGEVPLKLFFR
eukprot:TRINITY_DN12938_c0_g1_i1.p1 TRINITY_DN12938_c0_g1~~TRINITY_DN12938_c0_g1_i1.p1  ORF type:complete len:294 (-),score=2.64 TRINITY_DN12938_c0_g1_i1:110-991(-)